MWYNHRNHNAIQMLALTIVLPSGMLAIATVLHLAPRWHSIINSLNIFQESTQQEYFMLHIFVTKQLWHTCISSYTWNMLILWWYYSVWLMVLMLDIITVLIYSMWHTCTCVCSIHATSIMSCIFNFLNKHLGKVIELLRYQNLITMTDWGVFQCSCLLKMWSLSVHM